MAKMVLVCSLCVTSLALFVPYQVRLMRSRPINVKALLTLTCWHVAFAIGLVAPIVGRSILGHSGQAMVAVMILMAVTSTGSAEVLAATSILVFDIYQIYLKVRCIYIS